MRNYDKGDLSESQTINSTLNKHEKAKFSWNQSTNTSSVLLQINLSHSHVKLDQLKYKRSESSDGVALINSRTDSIQIKTYPNVKVGSLKTLISKIIDHPV